MFAVLVAHIKGWERVHGVATLRKGFLPLFEESEGKTVDNKK